MWLGPPHFTNTIPVYKHNPVLTYCTGQLCRFCLRLNVQKNLLALTKWYNSSDFGQTASGEEAVNICAEQAQLRMEWKLVICLAKWLPARSHRQSSQNYWFHSYAARGFACAGLWIWHTAFHWRRGGERERATIVRLSVDGIVQRKPSLLTARRRVAHFSD